MPEQPVFGRSLQQKILGIFLLLGIGLAAGAFVVLQYSVFPTFEKFEKEQSLDNLTRALKAIEYQLDNLVTLNREYADWDDTYEFAQNNNSHPDYIDGNLDPGNWITIDVDTMMILDTDGKLMAGKIIDPGSNSKKITEWSLETEILPLLTANHPMIKDETSTTNSDTRGLLSTPRGILMFASNRIVKTDRTGAYVGTFVTGRFLDNEQVANIGRRAKVDIKLYLVSDTKLPGHIQKTIHELVGLPTSSSTDHSDKGVYSRGIMRDVLGDPVALLEVHTQPRISIIGMETVKITLLFLSLAIALFIIIALAFLRRLIIRPIFALKNHITTIRQSGDLSIDFGSARDDEIGALAFEFGTLASELGGTQRQLEQARDDAEASSIAKSEFLANMSHEIRTPMNGVIGMTEVLLRTELSERQQHLAETVKTSSQILLNIINDILDFSKINAGKMLVEAKPFLFQELVRDINVMMAEPAEKKDIEYLCQIDSAIPECVVADDQRIRQVLINLIGNAIKFTHEGEVVLSVNCLHSREEQNERWLTLEFRIRDTGVGIRDEAQNKIFNSFAQADSGTTREYGGTGLGLAICKELVEKMGGEIAVDSVYGEGSEFHFALPMQVAMHDMADVPLLNGQLANSRVLVVDDNATNRDILHSHLAHWQAESDGACSGSEALQMLETALLSDYHYDFLLIDYHMPGMDGLEFASQVWKDSRFGKPIMIMLSSVSDEFASVDLASYGITTYLTKPVLQDELYKHICLALDGGISATGTTAEKDLDQKDELLFSNTDVLVAEDNRVNQELIEMLLQGLGARVVVTINGEEALQQLQEHAFDLVIMDCQMPVMDGFTATRKIRELGLLAKNGSPIPVMAMTANALEQDRENCINAGMDDYISKPFEYEQLLAVLKSLLGDKVEHTSPLDRDALDEVRALQGQGTPNILHRLIDVYLETSPGLMDELARGVSEKNAEIVEMNAHSLKSSSARLGASKFAGLCRQLEEMGRNFELDNCSKVFQGLSEEFNLICHALSTEKNMG